MKWFRRDEHYYLINMTNGNIQQISSQPPKNYTIVKNVDDILYITQHNEIYEVCGMSGGITFTINVLYQNDEFHIKDYDPSKIIRAILEQKENTCDCCDEYKWRNSNNESEDDSNEISHTKSDDSKSESSSDDEDLYWMDHKKIRYINSPMMSDTIELPSDVDSDLDIQLQHVQIQPSPLERSDKQPCVERPDNLL